MKKINLIIVAVVVLMAACQKNLVEVEHPMDEIQKQLVLDEALEQTLIDDLLNDIDNYSWIGDSWTKSAEVDLECPTITIVRSRDARWPCTLTIDFGEACEKAGKVKSGKMIIEKTGPWQESGSKRTITFDGYVVDGTAFSGTKVITNTTEDGGIPAFEIVADITTSFSKEIEAKDGGEGKTVVFETTRKDSKTQKWISGFGDREVQNVLEIDGSSEVIRKMGDEMKTIKKSFSGLTLKQGCRFPQAGVTEFDVLTVDGKNLKFAMDYSSLGDAAAKCNEGCDCYATLTVGDEQETIDLSERWWKKTKQDRNKE